MSGTGANTEAAKELESNPCYKINRIITTITNSMQLRS
jgi:hypothetical protein